MTKTQLIELVVKIMEASGTEEQINEWVTQLEENVPDPNVCDLIFYGSNLLTPEEIIDKAMAYKSIRL